MRVGGLIELLDSYPADSEVCIQSVRDHPGELMVWVGSDHEGEYEVVWEG